MTPTGSRRQFLRGASGVSIGIFAGCSTPANTRGEIEVPRANLPEERLTENGWGKIADREAHVFEKNYLFGTIAVSANQHTVIYEDMELRETINEQTLGNLDTALKTFFATRVNISPNLNSLPVGLGVTEVVNEAKSNAKDSFESRLQDAGLSNISESGTSEIQINTGESADLINYSAEYQYGSIPVPVPEAEDIVIPSGRLPVSGLLAVWPHDGVVLIAGGAFPSEDFEESAGTDVTEAVRVTVAIDLGLRPTDYRQEILGFIRSTR